MRGYSDKNALSTLATRFFNNQIQSLVIDNWLAGHFNLKGVLSSHRKQAFSCQTYNAGVDGWMAQIIHFQMHGNWNLQINGMVRPTGYFSV